MCMQFELSWTRVAPRFWRWGYNFASGASEKNWLPTFCLPAGHGTEHCTCFIIVWRLNAYLNQINLHNSGLWLLWRDWSLSHFLTNCTENGVARNIQDACEKLQIDHSINSVLNDVLFVTCVGPSCTPHLCKVGDIVHHHLRLMKSCQNATCAIGKNTKCEAGINNEWVK